MKILVVDDDEIALAVAQKVLRSDGHEVLLAEDGGQALNILSQNEIQMLISDWNMPNLDGIELCKQVRANSTVGYTYIMIVTARNSKDDLIVGLSAGADDFITKPFEAAELLLRVRNAERVLALETTSVTLFSLAQLAESKDTDTGAHLERIRAYCRLLAEQVLTQLVPPLNLPPRFAELLYQTSPLHDIGKVGIPDSILLKPGHLNDQEWMVMKRHAEIGAHTLDNVLNKFPNADFLRYARDIAWAHHERWDGSGYPRGLKGEEIPLSARIVAIADVYDALTMKRVYKTAMTHEVARGILLQGSGSHFDPALIQVFLKVEDQFTQIREQLSDEGGHYS
ncbi:MAG: HD domain-containing phosphohydrolase [Bacteroidales bacterium]